MEIKLKENSSVSIKNSQGIEICSVAEDGTVSGFGDGTKLYHHHLVSSDLVHWLDVILYDNVELTNNEHYDWLYLGKQILSGSGYNDTETATIYGIYTIHCGETLVVTDITGSEHYFSDLTDTVTPL